MIVIDQEFQSLIPPLSDDEYERLERSILAEGLREPIITWNGTIIDGHNRYNICDEHGIPFTQVEHEFPSRDAAKIWIIENQFGRRNLSPYDRSVLALQLEPLYAAEAERRLHMSQGRGKKGSQNSDNLNDNSEEGGKSYHLRTDEQLAKLAGTSRDTIRKVKVIETEADKGNQTAIDARESVKSGEKSINRAYLEVRPKGNGADSRPLCTVCGKPIDDGDSYDHDQFKHKACAYELEKKRIVKKTRCTDDGKHICNICGEPIEPGDAYDYEPNYHKKCRSRQHVVAQRKYRNPTIGDTSEVLTHDKAELRDSLLLVVQDMGDTLQSTINRYVTMGVKLNKPEQERIIKSLNTLTNAVNGIKE